MEDDQSLVIQSLFILGDFNALRRADYTEEQWTALEKKRNDNKIKSESRLTDMVSLQTGKLH